MGRSEVPSPSALHRESSDDAPPAREPALTQGGRVRIYGLDLGWYVQQIRMPVLSGSALAAGLTVLTFALSGVWADSADALSFMVKLAVWTFIGWKCVRRSGSKAGVAAMAAGLAGIAIGMSLSLLRLLVVREVWTLFNLIVEPVVSGIFGYLVGGATALASKSFTRPVAGYYP